MEEIFLVLWVDQGPGFAILSYKVNCFEMH